MTGLLDGDTEWPAPGEVYVVRLTPDGAIRSVNIAVPVKNSAGDEIYICRRPAGPRRWSKPWAQRPDGQTAIRIEK